MGKKELQSLFEKIMVAPINAPVRVIASAQLKMQLKMLIAISMIFEKVSIQELINLYIKNGGSKQEIEEFLKK